MKMNDFDELKIGDIIRNTITSNEYMIIDRVNRTGNPNPKYNRYFIAMRTIRVFNTEKDFWEKVERE